MKEGGGGAHACVGRRHYRVFWVRPKSGGGASPGLRLAPARRPVPSSGKARASEGCESTLDGGVWGNRGQLLVPTGTDPNKLRFYVSSWIFFPSTSSFSFFSFAVLGPMMTPFFHCL
ncbi:hypothetical protein IE53DRAFT_208534 [Violaceomyces palustris]|uniref:Uncharacterized protein n=1 Tax=Violaceomyces palustris TaxID=1673888 RepID=A0ACD0P4T6_9BASI|nr:hypothetical protein IE53DRAFT_208534 [Violaceomyces palustris]